MCKKRIITYFVLDMVYKYQSPPSRVNYCHSKTLHQLDIMAFAHIKVTLYILLKIRFVCVSLKIGLDKNKYNQ